MKISTLAAVVLAAIAFNAAANESVSIMNNRLSSAMQDQANNHNDATASRVHDAYNAVKQAENGSMDNSHMGSTTQSAPTAASYGFNAYSGYSTRPGTFAPTADDRNNHIPDAIPSVKTDGVPQATPQRVPGLQLTPKAVEQRTPVLNLTPAAIAQKTPQLTNAVPTQLTPQRVPGAIPAQRYQKVPVANLQAPGTLTPVATYSVPEQAISYSGASRRPGTYQPSVTAPAMVKGIMQSPAVATPEQVDSINVSVNSLKPDTQVNVTVEGKTFTTTAGAIAKVDPQAQISVPHMPVLVRTQYNGANHGNNGARKGESNGRGADNAHSHAFGGHGYGHDNSRSEGFGGHSHFH